MPPLQVHSPGQRSCTAPQRLCSASAAQNTLQLSCGSRRCGAPLEGMSAHAQAAQARYSDTWHVQATRRCPAPRTKLTRTCGLASAAASMQLPASLHVRAPEVMSCKQACPAVTVASVLWRRRVALLRDLLLHPARCRWPLQPATASGRMTRGHSALMSTSADGVQGPGGVASA